eukprot:TRINITY_DN4874_c0_g1_i2.p2 TRINITY_DN4874_c0_g1~~TRINITY_DN4874_c0_g1_i2.p2  ORF type:complete len:103 (+),score=21.02 TRINITY_DN4874_c0_g1_i2:57-365(+)
MNFATEFWDGFPMLCEHTEKGLNNFKDVAAFFKKISEIETEYGKAIKKSVKEVTKKGRLSGKVIMENEIGYVNPCQHSHIPTLVHPIHNGIAICSKTQRSVL